MPNLQLASSSSSSVSDSDQKETQKDRLKFVNRLRSHIKKLCAQNRHQQNLLKAQIPSKILEIVQNHVQQIYFRLLLQEETLSNSPLTFQVVHFTELSIVSKISINKTTKKDSLQSLIESYKVSESDVAIEHWVKNFESKETILMKIDLTQQFGSEENGSGQYFQSQKNKRLRNSHITNQQEILLFLHKQFPPNLSMKQHFPVFIKLFSPDPKKIHLSAAYKDLYPATLQPNYGISLTEVLRLMIDHEYSLHPNFICDLMVELSGALSLMHSCQVVHGDIKPGNVLVSLQQKVSKQDLRKEPCFQQKSEIERTLFYVFQNYGYSFETADFRDKKRSSQDSVKFTLIDYGNSFFAKESKQKNRENRSEIQPTMKPSKPIKEPCPTQSLPYRSPEAIYLRGSFPIDVWGCGCILLSLMTGHSEIFSLQEQLTEEFLENFFYIKSNQDHTIVEVRQKQWQQLIRDRTNDFGIEFCQEQSNQTLKKVQKMKQIAVQCLHLDQNRRPTAQQLSENFSSLFG